MPAVISHHLFGEEAYGALAPVVGDSAVARDAFLLGNQGPDPLFCLKALPSSVEFRNVGSVMHAQRPGELPAAFHRHFVERPGGNAPLKAFACGFLCHYLLDSIAHPLVYAQQYAVCAEGIEGLPPERSGREAHALIANNDHAPWPHPFKSGEVVSASFDELYDEALSQTLALVPRFVQSSFVLESSVNFYGQPAY